MRDSSARWCWGLAIGYFVFWFRKVRLGKALQPLLGSMLIPFVTLLVFGVLTYYVIGPVMSDLMGGLLHFLNTIPPSMKFAAAFLVGAMLAFDMGGPINKTALVLLLLTAGKTHL